jgi:hypothetical protein
MCKLLVRNGLYVVLKLEGGLAEGFGGFVTESSTTSGRRHRSFGAKKVLPRSQYEDIHSCSRGCSDRIL